MGRLFWKFFLAFWGCLLVATGTTFGVLDALEPPPIDVRLGQGPQAQFLLDTAEIVMKHEGAEGLKKTLNRMSLKLETPLPVFALSARGKEVLDRDMPEDLRVAFTKGLASSHPPQRGLRQITTPDKEKWALFILRPLEDPPENQEQTPQSPGDVRLVPGQPPTAGLVAAALASLLFAGILAHTYAKPFTRLKMGFQNASAGNLSTRLFKGKKPSSETDELLAGFDQMAQELHTQIEQQKTLLHDVSHELRSPLARLNLAVGLTRQSPNELQTSLNRIEREADRLDQLIGQLLTLSRLESARHQPAFEKHDVIELLENVLDDAQFEAEHKNRELIRNIETETWTMHCAPDALHSAFENVVRNAIKHTPEAGNIWIRADADTNPPHDLIIQVEDEGSGISPEHLPKLFEPFYKTGNHAGHGLGLAIVHKAVKLHSGTVTASQHDKGLCLTIRLQHR